MSKNLYSKNMKRLQDECIDDARHLIDKCGEGLFEWQRGLFSFRIGPKDIEFKLQNLQYHKQKVNDNFGQIEQKIEKIDEHAQTELRFVPYWGERLLRERAKLAITVFIMY